MKARCSLVPHDWDGIIRGLLDHDYDAIMSSLEITERRKRRIAFSRRYYRVPPALIGPKDADLGHLRAEALAGKRIGAVDRSEYASYIQSLHKRAELRTYGKLDEANLDLLTGRLDYVIGDKLALTRFLSSREGSCCRLVADVPADPAYFGHGFGIGLRREDEVLKVQFDRAIAKVMADGTYDRIREEVLSVRPEVSNAVGPAPAASREASRRARMGFHVYALNDAPPKKKSIGWTPEVGSTFGSDA